MGASFFMDQSVLRREDKGTKKDQGLQDDDEAAWVGIEKIADIGPAGTGHASQPKCDEDEVIEFIG